MHDNNKHIERTQKQQLINSEIKLIEQLIQLKISWTGHIERCNRKTEKELRKPLTAHLMPTKKHNDSTTLCFFYV